MRYENQTRGTSLTKEADTFQTAALPIGAATWLMSNKHRHAGDHAGLQVPDAAITSQCNDVPHGTAQHATLLVKKASRRTIANGPGLSSRLRTIASQLGQ